MLRFLESQQQKAPEKAEIFPTTTDRSEIYGAVRKTFTIGTFAVKPDDHRSFVESPK